MPRYYYMLVVNGLLAIGMVFAIRFSRPIYLLLDPTFSPCTRTAWQDGSPSEVRRPTKVWEGATLPVEPSRYGGIMQRVNQLRDPAVFVEDDTVYLLYSVAGEQGIAIGELSGL